MIQDLPGYASMRPTCLPGLPEIPAHWDAVPLCALASPKSVANKEHRELLSVYLHLGVVRFADVQEKRTNATSKDLSKYQAVDPGDFVLNNQQAWRGSVGVSRHKGIVSPAYLVLSLSSRFRPEFANLLFRERSMVSQYLVCSKGVGSIQRNLYWPHLKRVTAVLPPPDEQAAIVKFLGYANSRIQRYIQAKLKLIELLEEQKQVTIHRAVTRGVDPTARLKPSGVEWLGDVPGHWDVIPNRYLFRPVTRRERNGEEVKLSVTQKKGLVPTDEMMESSTQAANFDRFQVCIPGDLVLNKYKAHLGVFWAATRRGLITPNYTVFRPARALRTEYFEHLFHTRTYKDVLRVTVYGVTEGMSPLYTKDFLRIPSLVPPPEEQAQILSFVAKNTLIEDTAIDRVRHEIGLLREYRTRLTADVVTGQLDVREAASKLPDMIADQVAIDASMGDEDDDFDEDEGMES